MATQTRDFVTRRSEQSSDNEKIESLVVWGKQLDKEKELVQKELREVFDIGNE